MYRRIISDDGRPTAPLEWIKADPDVLVLSLHPSVNRCQLKAVVVPGQQVSQGEPLASGDSLTMHAPFAGRVEECSAERICLCVQPEESPAVFHPDPPADAARLPGFAAEMGLVGLGGSMFPSSVKLKASNDIHTLVINAVECEPGIEIDEALLLFETDRVVEGTRFIQRVLDVDRVVLATKKAALNRRQKKEPSLKKIAEKAGWDVEIMSDCYPAGAEKLIVAQLEGKMPATGKLPFHYGYLVMSCASLWSLGRSVKEGRPCIDRPLSLITPDHTVRNIVAPVGLPLRDLLRATDVSFDPATHILLTGGKMMGREAAPDTGIVKGTNAVFVLPVEERLTKPEYPCTRCGACYDICPLGLHPIEMARRIQAGDYTGDLKAQLNECFLCGACSAVCPSDIPLVQYFHKGKQWLKENG